MRNLLLQYNTSVRTSLASVCSLVTSGWLTKPGSLLHAVSPQFADFAPFTSCKPSLPFFCSSRVTTVPVTFNCFKRKLIAFPFWLTFKRKFDRHFQHTNILIFVWLNLVSNSFKFILAIKTYNSSNWRTASKRRQGLARHSVSALVVSNKTT